MLCPNCGNRMFDDGLDDLLSCGACGNYEKKNRQVFLPSIPFDNSAQVIASYNASRDSETERETVARQLAETEIEKRNRALAFSDLFYTVAPFARGNA